MKKSVPVSFQYYLLNWRFNTFFFITQIKNGDEIDIIKEFSPLNPEHLIVSRIEILSIQPNSEDITVVMRRFKSLTIENYEAENVWKGNS